VFSTQPVSAQAGTAIPTVRVSALDASNNVVTGYSGTITVAIGTNPAAGTLTGTLSTAAVSGVASFANLIIDNAGSGYTLTAAASGLTGVTSAAFTITAPPATHLAFSTQPTNTQAGTTIATVRVSALDASNNVVPGFTGSITVAIGTNPASGTLSGTLTVAAVSGVATFSTLSINQAGNGYTLAASSSGLTGATSGVFNVTAAPPPPATHLAFTAQPTNTQVGSTVSPAVQVSALDASNAVVAGFTGTITVAIGTNPAGGTLSGTLTVAAVNGVAAFSTLSINQVGNGYTLAASSSGLTGATSGLFNITAPPATHLIFSTQPTSTQAGATIPTVRVSALDASNAVVTGYTGTITVGIGVNPASGTLSGTATVAAVSGVATFTNLSINAAGTGTRLPRPRAVLPVRRARRSTSPLRRRRIWHSACNPAALKQARRSLPRCRSRRSTHRMRS